MGFLNGVLQRISNRFDNSIEVTINLLISEAHKANAITFDERLPIGIINRDFIAVVRWPVYFDG